jgi:predicted nucleic acid-binding protein
MNAVFVDTHYWIASINPHDQWYQRALEVEGQLAGANLVTTEEVLVETLNYFASSGQLLRLRVARVVRRLFERPEVEVIPQTEDSFFKGVSLYEVRIDKGYSLTDCISMNAMLDRGLTDVLTHDHHLTQEGFRILL